MKDIKKGQWIFTCSMQPQQFDHWINDDDFVTEIGSHHSLINCSLKIISDEYAKFFNDNELWNLFDEDDDNRWDKYENRLKRVCEEFDVKYEGL